MFIVNFSRSETGFLRVDHKIDCFKRVFRYAIAVANPFAEPSGNIPNGIFFDDRRCDSLSVPRHHGDDASGL